jgi:hypothetical protein
LNLNPTVWVVKFLSGPDFYFYKLTLLTRSDFKTPDDIKGFPDGSKGEMSLIENYFSIISCLFRI